MDDIYDDLGVRNGTRFYEYGGLRTAIFRVMAADRGRAAAN